MAARTKARPGYATPAQAGEYLGIATQTLANWRSLGKGPKFSKVGRQKVGRQIVRYRWADLDAFMNADT